MWSLTRRDPAHSQFEPVEAPVHLSEVAVHAQLLLTQDTRDDALDVGQHHVSVEPSPDSQKVFVACHNRRR